METVTKHSVERATDEAAAILLLTRASFERSGLIGS